MTSLATKNLDLSALHHIGLEEASTGFSGSATNGKMPHAPHKTCIIELALKTSRTSRIPRLPFTIKSIMLFAYAIGEI